MSLRTLIPSLALLIASGSLQAQEAVHQAKPDPSLKYHYKRFTRGDNEKIVDEAWGRHQWWLERMGGELGPDFFQHYIKEAEKERARNPRLFPRPGVEMPVAITEGAWTNIGPTTAAFASNGTTLNIVDSGRARVILPHPTNPDIVYFLNAGGGLWKTTNFTAADTAWTPTTDSIGSTAGGSAAFGRTPEVLYLGTGDAFDGGVGGFIVKSTDAAATWGSAVFLPGATKVLDLQVDTSGAQDILLVGTNAGLFRSADAGATFTAIGGVFAGKKVWSLVRTSAGWLANAQVPPTTTAGVGVGALYLSTDQGLTWNPITNTGNVYTGAGRSTLAVAEPGDSVVYCYAANVDDAAQLDLFKSTDGGQTWVALGITAKIPAKANSHQADMDIMAGQAFYNHMLLVDPTDPSRNTVMVGGQLATARSTDGGANWTLLTDWLPNGTTITLPYSHADHHCAAITNIGGTKRIFFGHDGGLTYSQDNGVTFDDKKNNGLATHLIYALAVNPKQTGSALIGLQDNGTRSRVLSPLGTTYNQIRGGDGFGVGWAPGSGYSLSSYVYNAIQRSTTNPPIAQANWSTFTTGLPTPIGNSPGASANYYFVTPIITPNEQADPTGNVFFTYGRKGIYKSNSTGWTTIGTPGTGGITAGRVVRAVSHGLGVHPSNLNFIGAAGSGGYLMLTTDGGSSWTERLLGTNGTDGQNIGWYGFNSNVAWATDQILFACSEATFPGAAHVAKSTDGGVNWTRSDAGLPDVPVTKIVMDMGDGTSKTAYAATWLGVYRTTDGGANWTRFGTGLPQGRVSDIYVAPDSSFIRIATWGRGVWEMVNVPTTGTVSLTPTAAFLYPGQTATFTATVNGGGTVNYTATGGTITAGGVYTAGSTAGSYSVVATNAADPTKSATVPVTVAVPVAVAFSTQPQNVTSGVGLNATFTVAATGTGPLSYQWKKNGTAISGATSASYTTPALALADNSSTFLCEVTGLAGMVPSNAATLTVKALGTGTNVSNTTVGLIPDTGSTGAPLDVPFVVSGVAGDVADVTVGLYVTHTWVGDLTITLLAPDGTSTILATKIGGGNYGLNNTLGKALGSACGTPTVISDAGTKAIQTAVSADLPLVGTWVPYQAMASFRGKSPNGTWILRLKDNGAGDQGTFQCGSLTVTPFAAAVAPSFDVNSDGTVDGYDLLAFLKSYGSTADADLSKADFNTDGQINDTDLTAMLGAL